MNSRSSHVVRLSATPRRAPAPLVLEKRVLGVARVHAREAVVHPRRASAVDASPLLRRNRDGHRSDPGLPATGFDGQGEADRLISIVRVVFGKSSHQALTSSLGMTLASGALGKLATVLLVPMLMIYPLVPVLADELPVPEPVPQAEEAVPAETSDPVAGEAPSDTSAEEVVTELTDTPVADAVVVPDEPQVEEEEEAAPPPTPVEPVVDEAPPDDELAAEDDEVEEEAIPAVDTVATSSEETVSTEQSTEAATSTPSSPATSTASSTTTSEHSLTATTTSSVEGAEGDTTVSATTPSATASSSTTTSSENNSGGSSAGSSTSSTDTTSTSETPEVETPPPPPAPAPSPAGGSFGTAAPQESVDASAVTSPNGGVADATSTPSDPTSPSDEVHVAYNNDSRYVFGAAECVLIRPGEFYCMQKDTSPSGQAGSSVLPTPSGVSVQTDQDGDKEIFFTVNGSSTQITHNTYDDDAPAYDEQTQTIVWHASVKGRTQIFAYNLETGATIQVTNTSFNNQNPQISAGTVVWQGWVNENWEIFTAADVWSGALNIAQITHNDIHDMFPKVHNALVSWQASVAGVWQVYVYNLTTGETSNLAANEGSYENPRYVILLDNRKSNGDVEQIGYDIASGQTLALGTSPRPKGEPLLPASPMKSDNGTLPGNDAGAKTAKTPREDSGDAE